MNLDQKKVGKPDLTVIILTFNEEKHIERCIKSALQIAHQVFIVDSFSTDKTITIAKTLGVSVWQHEFTNHAAQLDWAMQNLPIDTTWVMRVDADEVISEKMSNNLRHKLLNAGTEVNGFLVCRYVRFMGSIIRHGGFPQWNLRIWRNGKATVEQRWMDEHIVLNNGESDYVHGDFIDANLNSISWWIQKHNDYASREAIELLNAKYRFFASHGNGSTLNHHAKYKRWLKENVYSRLPLGLRTMSYYIYRMIFQLGFLDGRAGLVFHFLQGFWYRFLVDVKIAEVERRMRIEGINCVEAIRREFGIKPQ